MMALSDPPRHHYLRDSVAPMFSARSGFNLKQRITDLTDTVVDNALERQEVDFVSAVAAIVPMTIMCDMMGVPESDRQNVVGLCEQAFMGQTADQRRNAHQSLLPYLFDLAVKRRASPGDDIVSAFARESKEAGRTLTFEEVVLNCDNIIVGGVQTVRHTATMSMKALMEHPAAWRALQQSQDDIKTAVEELLRWTSVGLHVLRTAKRDTILRGRAIRAGDRVVVWTPAANRDESAFPHPSDLDLSRHPNRHLAFGWGPHYCIGAVLARMELQALFTALARKAERVEQLAPGAPNLSIINFGLDTFPVRLYPRRARGGSRGRRFKSGSPDSFPGHVGTTWP